MLPYQQKKSKLHINYAKECNVPTQKAPLIGLSCAGKSTFMTISCKKSSHYKTRVTLFTSLLNNAINGLICAFLRDNFLLGQLFYISQRRCMLETIFKEGQEMVVKVLLPAQLRPIRGAF